MVDDQADEKETGDGYDWQFTGSDGEALLAKASELASSIMARAQSGLASSSPPMATAEHLEGLPLPDGPSDPSTVLELLDECVASYPFGSGHPRFAAWMNPPVDAVGLASALIGAALNPSMTGGDHAAIHLERKAISWLGELVGLSSEMPGLLTSGGSMANLIGMAAALRGCDEDSRTPHVFLCEATHGCIWKSVRLLGLKDDEVTTLGLDCQHRLDTHQLHAAVRAHQSCRPVIVATAGSVSTGAMDELQRLVAIRDKFGGWLHVDGAYGALSNLIAEPPPALIGLSAADSVVVDPHKWLYAPAGLGAIFVREIRHLTGLFGQPRSYTAYGSRDEAGPTPWFVDMGIEQNRGLRGLYIWLAVLLRGRDQLRAAVERDIENARALADEVREAPDFELLEPQTLSIVCLKYAPRGQAVPARRMAAIVDELTLRGRYRVGGVLHAGSLWIRVCFLNPTRGPREMVGLLDHIRELAMRQSESE